MRWWKNAEKPISIPYFQSKVVLFPFRNLPQIGRFYSSIWVLKRGLFYRLPLFKQTDSSRPFGWKNSLFNEGPLNHQLSILPKRSGSPAEKRSICLQLNSFLMTTKWRETNLVKGGKNGFKGDISHPTPLLRPSIRILSPFIFWLKKRDFFVSGKSNCHWANFVAESARFYGRRRK